MILLNEKYNFLDSAEGPSYTYTIPESTYEGGYESAKPVVHESYGPPKGSSYSSAKPSSSYSQEPHQSYGTPSYGKNANV